jgi:hypothetical protein
MNFIAQVLGGIMEIVKLILTGEAESNLGTIATTTSRFGWRLNK